MFAIILISISLGLHACADTDNSYCGLHPELSIWRGSERSRPFDIFKMLQKGENLIEYGQDRELIVFLSLNEELFFVKDAGVGSGTRALVRFLSGTERNMTTKTRRFYDRFNEDVIEDECPVWGRSHHLLPETMVDPISKTSYVYVPGFDCVSNDMNGYDIAAYYFMKKRMDHAERVKFVFLIHEFHVHPSKVDDGYYRLKFLQLVYDAGTLFRNNLTKFENSIALIVTGVQNIYTVDSNGNRVLEEDDAKVVQNTVQYLRETRKIYVANGNSFGIELIDVFLRRQDEKFSRIGVLRAPDHPVGRSVEDDPLLRESKRKVKSFIVDTSIHFANASEEDFCYTLHDNLDHENDKDEFISIRYDRECASKHIVRMLTEQVPKSVRNRIENFGDRIIERIEVAQRNLSDFSLVHLVADSRVNRTEDFKSMPVFIDFLSTYASRYRVNITDEELTAMRRDQETMDSMIRMTACGRYTSAINWPEVIEDGMRRLTEYLDKQQTWFGFLKTLFDDLAPYVLEKSRIPCLEVLYLSNKLQVILYDDAEETIRLSKLETTIEPFLKRVVGSSSNEMYQQMKHVVISKGQLKYLEIVLSYLDREPTITCILVNGGRKFVNFVCSWINCPRLG